VTTRERYEITRGKQMKIVGLVLMATLTAAASAQTPAGKWHDVTVDSSGWMTYGKADDTKLLISEDYVVTETHEVCANVYGYFMEKSQQGRYNVSFKGMRTSATFTFTTQYDAEHWAQKWCTPESLQQIKAGKGEFARKY
jgi:hypothetical protein